MGNSIGHLHLTIKLAQINGRPSSRITDGPACAKLSNVGSNIKATQFSNLAMRPYKGFIKDDPNFKTLFENTVMTVGHVFGTSYCYNKLTKEEFAIFEFDNDPTCGLVGQRNDWCLIGGDVLVLRTWVDNTLRLVGELKQIFGLKTIDDYTVQILTNPWADNSEIWRLTIDLNNLTRPLTLIKVRDFKEYADKLYTDQVEW